jgi:hypothetical protein
MTGSLGRLVVNVDSFGIRVDETTEAAGGIMVFRARQVDETKAATAQGVSELLRLSPNALEFRLAFGAVPQGDTEIAMLTRSTLKILAEASAGVDIPASDGAGGPSAITAIWHF